MGRRTWMQVSPGVLDTLELALVLGHQPVRRVQTQAQRLANGFGA